MTLKLPPIAGIFPPVITPFRENGDVDYDSFVRNIGRWNQDRLGGYLVLGSNSETPYLSEEEKLRLVELAVQTAAEGRVVLAGTGLESTRETVRFTNAAARLGVDAALVLTPSYFADQMSDAALIRHFTSIADDCDIPILIYNVPKFTHVNVSVEAVRVLSGHPNVAGMKDSRGDAAQLAAFKRAVPAQFNLIVGSASVLYSAFEVGIRAGIVALANCAPRQCADIQRLYDAGDQGMALALQSSLNPVNKAVTETYGVAGLKYAATLMGYEGGYVRGPLMELTGAERREVRMILREAGLLSTGD